MGTAVISRITWNDSGELPGDGRLGREGPGLLSYAGSSVNNCGQCGGNDFLMSSRNYFDEHKTLPAYPSNQAGGGYGNGSNHCRIGSSANVIPYAGKLNPEDLPSWPNPEPTPPPSGMPNHPLTDSIELYAAGIPGWPSPEPTPPPPGVPQPLPPEHMPGDYSNSVKPYQEQRDPTLAERQALGAGWKRAKDCASMLKGGFEHHSHGESREYSSKFVQCIIEQLHKVKYQFGGCCGPNNPYLIRDVPWVGGLVFWGNAARCCGPFMQLGAMNCGNNKVVWCGDYLEFSYNHPTRYSDGKGEIAHTVLHEAIHSCMRSAIAFEIGTGFTRYGVVINPTDTIAYDMLVCCGCDYKGEFG